MGEAKLCSHLVDLPGARPLMKPLNKKLLYFHSIKCKVDIFFEFNVKRAASSFKHILELLASSVITAVLTFIYYNSLSIIIGFSCICVNKGTN